MKRSIIALTLLLLPLLAIGGTVTLHPADFTGYPGFSPTLSVVTFDNPAANFDEFALPTLDFEGGLHSGGKNGSIATAPVILPEGAGDTVKIIVYWLRPSGAVNTDSFLLRATLSAASTDTDLTTLGHGVPEYWSYTLGGASGSNIHTTAPVDNLDSGGDDIDSPVLGVRTLRLSRHNGGSDTMQHPLPVLRVDIEYWVDSEPAGWD